MEYVEAYGSGEVSAMKSENRNSLVTTSMELLEMLLGLERRILNSDNRCSLVMEVWVMDRTSFGKNMVKTALQIGA